ncbi:MAG TPA: non-canonical purine NTP pyrophosphatase, RdgB/HAM1 family [Candidatus Moranbacteria bacterium]|nr:non-canonical purine NTP pyrophosphatase, RdgB/HAM1 family [Candidatus Moranbacteria bacterium]
MKKEILIATENLGKAKEIEEIFKDTDYKLRFLYEFQDQKGELDIQENAKSFEGNALIKAIIVGEKFKMFTLADDSGICVDVLGGMPGVYSARYSEEKTAESNNAKLLAELKDVPIERRYSHFHCAVAIYDPKTNFIETVEGKFEGRIAISPKGNGFGYNPIFLSKDFDYQKTSAELEKEKLISINHRGKAFRKAIEVLNKYFS